MVRVLNMLAGVVAGALLAVWPLLNFLSHNKHENLEFGPIVIAGIASVLAAGLVAGIVFLLSFRRVSSEAALMLGGLILAMFWSFDVVEAAYLAAGVPTGTELAAWGGVAAFVIAVAGWALRRPSVRRAVAFSACILAAIPAVDFGVYAARNYDFGAFAR